MENYSHFLQILERKMIKSEFASTEEKVKILNICHSVTLTR